MCDHSHTTPADARWCARVDAERDTEHNHFDDRDARDDCPACAEAVRQAGG